MRNNYPSDKRLEQNDTGELDTGEITAKNTPLTIGQAGIGKPNEYFFGIIDEVRIYNRALTDVEIQSLYKQR
jgi:hypothetical protein